MSYDAYGAFEALFRFNESLHNAVICLEALTGHDGFDQESIKTHAAEFRNARSRANAFLIGEIQKAESKAERAVR